MSPINSIDFQRMAVTFQKNADEYGAMLKDKLSCVPRLRAYLETSHGENWCEEMGLWLVKIPPKTALSVVELIIELMTLTAYAAVHPVKGSQEIVEKCLLLLKAMITPETWPHLGVGFLAGHLAEAAVFGSPLSLYVALTAGILIVAGITVDTLYQAYKDQNTPYLETVKSRLSYHAQRLPETFLCSLLLGAIIGQIRKMIIGPIPLGFRTTAEKFIDDNNFPRGWKLGNGWQYQESWSFDEVNKSITIGNWWNKMGISGKVVEHFSKLQDPPYLPGESITISLQNEIPSAFLSNTGRALPHDVVGITKFHITTKPYIPHPVAVPALVAGVNEYMHSVVNTPTMNFVPPLQKRADEIGAILKDKISCVEKLREFLETQHGEHWCTQMAAWLAKLPLKSALSIVELIVELLTVTAYTIVHPIEGSKVIIEKCLALLKAIVTPENWPHLGVGFLGGHLAEVAVLGSPISLYVALVAGVLVATGITVDTLYRAYKNHNIHAFDIIKERFTFHAQRLPEAFLSSLFLGAIASKIRKMVIKPVKLNFRTYAKNFIHDNNLPTDIWDINDNMLTITAKVSKTKINFQSFSRPEVTISFYDASPKASVHYHYNSWVGGFQSPPIFIPIEELGITKLHVTAVHTAYPVSAPAFATAVKEFARDKD